MKKVLFTIGVIIVTIVVLWITIDAIFFTHTARGAFFKSNIYGKSEVIKLYTNNHNDFKTVMNYIDGYEKDNNQMIRIERADDKTGYKEGYILNSTDSYKAELWTDNSEPLKETTALQINDSAVNQAINNLLFRYHMIRIDERESGQYHYIVFVTDKGLSRFSNGIIYCERIDKKIKYITYMNALGDSFYYFEEGY